MSDGTYEVRPHHDISGLYAAFLRGCKRRTSGWYTSPVVAFANRSELA